MSELTKEDVDKLCSTFPPLLLMAIVLGYNELARNSKNAGDILYFRIMRDQYHEALKAHPQAGDYSIDFKAPEP